MYLQKENEDIFVFLLSEMEREEYSREKTIQNSQFQVDKRFFKEDLMSLKGEELLPWIKNNKIGASSYERLSKYSMENGENSVKSFFTKQQKEIKSLKNKKIYMHNQAFDRNMGKEILKEYDVFFIYDLPSNRNMYEVNINPVEIGSFYFLPPAPRWVNQIDTAQDIKEILHDVKYKRIGKKLFFYIAYPLQMMYFNNQMKEYFEKLIKIIDANSLFSFRKKIEIEKTHYVINRANEKQKHLLEASIIERPKKEQTYLNKIQENYILLEKEKHLFANIKTISKTKVKIFIKTILADKRVEDIQVNNKDIYILTNKLIATDKDEDEYDIGRYQIKISLNSIIIKIHNRDFIERMTGRNHPHINSNGTPCWGTASSIIADLFKKIDFLGLVFFVLTYLETINIDDEWGKDAKYWNNNENKKFFEKGDRNESNLIDNTSNYLQ